MIDVDQPAHASPSGEIRHGVRQVAHDVIMLAELQADLLRVEVRDLTTHIAIPAVAMAAGAVIFALTSLPVLLLCVAYALNEYAGWSLTAAMGAAGGGGAVIAVILGFLAVKRIKNLGNACGRSRAEFTRNVQWLKEVLSHPAETADSIYPESGRMHPR
jgi:hypothetical protein